MILYICKNKISLPPTILLHNYIYKVLRCQSKMDLGLICDEAEPL